MPLKPGSPVDVQGGEIRITRGTIIIKPRFHLSELLASAKTKQDVTKFLKKNGAKDIKFSQAGIQLTVANIHRRVEFCAMDLESIIKQAVPARPKIKP